MTKPIYRDTERTLDERVADLLARMTLEEKIGQLMQLDGRQSLEETIHTYRAGSILHCLGERVMEAQTLASKTRLGIPVLFAEDGIHGHSFWPGATIFPTQLAMASSWNPDLIERMARVTALEMSCTGPKWTFSPVLCLARDLRWGRIGETFGEDPFLIGEFARAMIRGYQGEGLHDPTAVLATAKHYAGYSETQGGRDASEADISKRKLMSYFLPPFETAAKSGCMAFMTGYQSMDGVPSTANRWLLRETLKEAWGFDGVLVTDWDNVGRLVREQKVCANRKEAAALALASGNDIMMATPDFFEGAQEAVAEGLIKESDIDEVVARMLALKFKLGLFENPCMPDAARQAAVIGCAEHGAVNLEAARQSLTLLRNEGPLLPLPGNQPLRIAVVGPNADDPLAQLGDWSLGSGQLEQEEPCHPRACTTTVLDGLRARAPAGSVVTHATGCSIGNEDESGIPEAVQACEDSDVIVLAVGDTHRFIGETRSTATLELQGGQRALAEAVMALNKPTIVVLINSKPMVLPPALHRAAVLIEMFNPGMKGGQALAEALFGDFNPCGRLTISFPHHVGQQPVFYSQVRGQHGKKYADLTQDPLFAFGEGLSYTRFVYGAPELDSNALTTDAVLRATVAVTNIGDRDGIEVVQAYVRDRVTSATWVDKELKAFARVAIAAGETCRVTLTVPVSACSLVNAAGERVVEPGDFELLVGASSRERDLQSVAFSVRAA